MRKVTRILEGAAETRHEQNGETRRTKYWGSKDRAAAGKYLEVPPCNSFTGAARFLAGNRKKKSEVTSRSKQAGAWGPALYLAADGKARLAVGCRRRSPGLALPHGRPPALIPGTSPPRLSQSFRPPYRSRAGIFRAELAGGDRADFPPCNSLPLQRVPVLGRRDTCGL
ncbi:hypothetical protein J1605_006309 [Eschrichtius robustus]|uniref:Uncharacterized protein n=1 Tax=Eschrichtius robustus TaxID=9764 RepID=A0AB34H6J2_ESCRO|nr:hypothetical protein J1605_010671 [Eschrichtius robustus]KAJ8786334.1 hypothetical protein J1605_006309 [Eschrichtius robustus]